jgi:squalene-hopene/tetraprenyl-beta-curcumene cyclase
LERWERGEARRASPIGLYFARLWYHESLYPLIFLVDALNHLGPKTLSAPESTPSDPGSSPSSR